MNLQSDPLTLRCALPEDLPFQQTLYRSTRDGDLARWGWNEAQAQAFAAMQFTAQTADYARSFPGARTFIVLHGNTPIGRLIIDREKACIRLIDISLLPDWQGQGIGRRLITGLLEEARISRKPLILTTQRINRAAALYRRLGFQVTRETELDLEMGWAPTMENGPLKV